MRTAIRVASALLLLTMAGCSSRVDVSPPDTANAATTAAVAPSSTVSYLGDQNDTFSLDELPPASRVAMGAAEPRTADYWVEWSSCGEGSRAAIAAQNGGRAAGWIIVDDLIADPGIAVGEYVIATCEEAVRLLSLARPDSAVSTDPAEVLAGLLLTAQLNLFVGAETCPAAEEAVMAAHILLSSVGFDPSLENGIAVESTSVEPFLRLLGFYTQGTLCE